MTVFPPNPTDGQQVVFSLKTYEWNGSRWISVGAELNASNLVAGTVAVARGGTGSSTAPMMGVITAANAAAAQDVLAGTTVGKAVFTAVDAAAARTAIGSGSGSGSGDLLASNNLSELTATAATARTNLQLGTVATTAATAYATAAQGSKADSALQDVVSDTSPQLGGNLDVQAQTITTTTSNGNIVVDPPGTGFLQVEGTTNPGKIRLMCEAGTHGVGLISPVHSTGANYDLVLPTATGSANQALKTDGSGNLGWSTLGTAAAAATGDFEASGAIATAVTAHNNITNAHGISAFGSTLVDDANAAAALVTLGAQPVDADLTAIAGLTSAANKGIQFTGSGSAGVYDLTAAGKALLDDADATAQRLTLGLGTAATSATGDFVASSAVSTFGATLVDDADAAAARTTLGAAATNHSHTASQLTGDMPDARIVASNVTQHAAQIDIGDLGNVTQGAGLLGAGSGLYWNGSAWAAGALQATSVPSLAASKITSGQLAVAQGGTGVASLPMVSIPGAADASAARTVLGVTNAGSYTGHIETGSVKEFTLDPTVATSRTITQFYIQSGNQSGSGGGTGAFILKKKSGSTITTLSTASSVSNSSTTQTIAVSSLAANDRLYLDCTTNSSLVDVIFAVEYTE